MSAATLSIPGLASHIRDRVVSAIYMDYPGARSLTLTAAVSTDGSGSAEVRVNYPNGTFETATMLLPLSEDADEPDVRLHDLIESAIYSAPCSGRIDTDQCSLMVSDVGEDGLVLVGISVDGDRASTEHDLAV